MKVMTLFSTGITHFTPFPTFLETKVTVGYFLKIRDFVQLLLYKDGYY